MDWQHEQGEGGSRQRAGESGRESGSRKRGIAKRQREGGGGGEQREMAEIDGEERGGKRKGKKIERAE